MTQLPIDLEAEHIVQDATAELLFIRPGECLVCYVDRMVADVGCDTTLRFAMRFRDARAPRATGLSRRLGYVGGFCDCEILMNGWWMHPRFWSNPPQVVEDGIVMQDDPEPPDPSPPCAGVRRGSTRPCANWVRATQHPRRGW